jgi:mRNA interferase MazF
MNVPDRGDLIYIDFDPGVGHEQMKRRPALVLSPQAFNRAFNLAFVAPVTSKPRGHAFEIPLPTGLGVQGSVMVEQLKSFDWRGRNAEHVGKAPASVTALAVEIINRVIG